MDREKIPPECGTLSRHYSSIQILAAESVMWITLPSQAAESEIGLGLTCHGEEPWGRRRALVASWIASP
jgi:hypothetical protein